MRQSHFEHTNLPILLENNRYFIRLQQLRQSRILAKENNLAFDIEQENSKLVFILKPFTLNELNMPVFIR